MRNIISMEGIVKNNGLLEMQSKIYEFRKNLGHIKNNKP
jgi:hypothetical protein